MAEGRILFFHPHRTYPNSWVGAIVDDAIEGGADRATDVWFDERGMPRNIDLALVTPGVRVTFKYAAAMDSQKRLRADRVSIAEDLQAFEFGNVLCFKPSPRNPNANYGFVAPDAGGPNVWFNRHAIVGAANLVAGSRVIFRRALNTEKARATFLKEAIE